MKHLFALLLALGLVFGARAAAPSYSNFYTNDFSTNNFLIKVKWLNAPAVSNFYVTNILVVETGYFGNLYISNNLFVSNIYATNIYASNIITTNIFVTNVYVTNFNATNITVNNLYATNIFTTNLFSSNIFTTNIFANTTYTTNLFVTNVVSSNFFTTNLFVNNAYTTNLFASNFFTTNLFVNNNYTTNLYSSNAFITNLFVNNNYSTNLFSSNHFTTNLFVNNSYFTNIANFISNINVAVSVFVSNNIFVNSNAVIGGTNFSGFFVGNGSGLTNLNVRFWTNANTYYVAAESTSNGVKGLIEYPYAISNAWAAAAAGDTIVILPGTYAVTNMLTNKVFMNIVGIGNPLLRFFNLGVTNGQPNSCIIPADNNFIGYLSITNAAWTHGSTIGLSHLFGNNACTNVLVDTVQHSGGSDGTWFRHTNRCQVTFVNNKWSNPWDNHLQAHSADHEFTFRNCVFDSVGPYFTPTGTSSPPAMNRVADLVTMSGTSYVYNCWFHTRGSTNGNWPIYIPNDAGFVAGATVIAKDSVFITTNEVANLTASSQAIFIDCQTNGIFLTTTNYLFGTDLTVAGSLTNLALSPNMPVWTDAGSKLVSVSPSWLPTPNYELWYEPFSGGDATTGLIGLMNWSIGSAGVGGGGVNFSNAPNHFGTMNLGTSASANSIAFLFNSDSANGKPTIAPLNATTGWTNRFIWRMNNTNTARLYFGFIGNANYTVNAALENSICFFINTTNSNMIMGHTSVGSAVSTTNIVGIVNNQWYTNEMWSDTSGVISFNVNGGAPAMLAANLPTSSLTPSFGIIKQATDVAVNFEVDEWIFFWKRQ